MAPTRVDPVVHGDTTTAATRATTRTTTCTDSVEESTFTSILESESTSESTSEFTSKSTPKTQDAGAHPHHVLFVVHGMGRQLEEHGNYERNVSHLVENTKTVLQSAFHDLQTDVHIIPTEWHSKLHSLVDDRMALASLRTVPKVRMVMNDYLADILYYFNSHFGSEIIRMIVEELNDAYETFMTNHPDFNGKISIFALSLGGVAMFDILTCIDDDVEEAGEPEQSKPGSSADMDVDNASEDVQVDPMAKAEVVSENNTPDKKKKSAKSRKQDQQKFRAVIPKLKFRPNYLFTVGSPVGAVMVMRNLDWESFHPPDDIIHHNLFHPFDPLGYRIEPLIDPVFAGVPAAPLSSYNTSQTLFSLPSLPSLLPGSISSFWENKVPTLPRPSIPALSSLSLSQMTQSLKAGRWLSSGNGNEDTNVDTNGERNGEAAEESEVSTPTSAIGGEEDINLDKEAASSIASSVSDRDSAALRRGSSKAQEGVEIDADASATEYMAALTVSTYLDPSGASSSSTKVDEGTAQIDTTTRSSPSQSERVRRPSLGPRRISSRVEEVQDPANATPMQDNYRSSSDSVLGRKLDGVKEEIIGALPSPSPMEMEYFLGMETGATAEEKAQGLGAKSDVVQESMVRAMPLPKGEENNSQQQKKADVHESAADDKKNQHKVHVEGRPTKVPYRIDHVLQETTVDQYTNEYLLGMRSHFRYWGNRDIAYHILRTMLQDKDPSSSDDKILDLKLSLPPPVTISKGAKEAAEVKAKLAATSARNRSNSGDSVTDQETKKRNRTSFTFPFFGALDYSSSEEGSSRERQLEQERIRKQEEIDEDLAMMDEESELFGSRYSNIGMDSKFESGTDRPTKPRLSHNPVSHSESSMGSTAPSEDKVATQHGWVPAPVPVSVSVPELTRPAKLHHRSS
ncbi:hypothetical protein BGX27_011206 [Mortierella sp. AM989]|nr:hypothetical protein BGX27_011206 [Mortierella sp. AM989]